MKKITLLIMLSVLCNLIALGQKKYEMVIEKKDGTSIAIKTEDIKRTFFREIQSEEGGDTGNTGDTGSKIDVSLLYGTWKCLSEEGVDYGKEFYTKHNPPFYYRYNTNNTFYHYKFDQDTEKWERGKTQTMKIKVDDNGKTFIVVDHNGDFPGNYEIIELTGTTLKTYIEDNVGKKDYWNEIETCTRVDDEELNALMRQNGDM